jgi:Tol biopolymer transport system component
VEATTSSAGYLISEIKRHKRGTVIFLVTVIVTVGLTFAFYQLANLRQSRLTASPQDLKLTRLTTSGKATLAAISPDGRYLVHVMSEAGQQSLWLRQVTTTSSVQIAPPAEVEYQGLTFSADGDHLYYVVTEKGSPKGVLYEMPTLGGMPRRLIVDVYRHVALSPDAKRLAFLRSGPTGNASTLLVANTDGSGERKLATRTLPDYFAESYSGGLAWSPDGKIIACVSVNWAKSYHVTVVGVRVDDGVETR